MLTSFIQFSTVSFSFTSYVVEMSFLQNYLERYGYLAGLGGAGGSMHSLGDREEAIR